MEENQIRFVEENRNYVKWLEIFNNDTSILNERYSSFQLSFITFNKKIEKLFEKFSGECTENGKEQNTHLTLTSTQQQFSKLIQKRLHNEIKDSFTLSQVQTARCIFAFFQNISKIFYSYQPNLNPNFKFPSTPLVFELKKRFPKAVQNVANKLEMNAEEFSSLTEIPPNFPTFKLAYVVLLNELTEIEKLKTAEEASLVSQLDQKLIHVHCPPPGFVAEMQEFQKFKQIQKELIEYMRIFVSQNEKKHKHLLELKSLLNEKLFSISHLITFEAPQVIASLMNSYKTAVEKHVHKHEVNFVIHLRNNITEVDIPRTYENFLDLEQDLVSIESPDLELIYQQMVNLKPVIESENARLKEELIKKEKKVERNQRTTDPQAPKSERKINEKIKKLREKIKEQSELTLNAISTLMEIDIPLENAEKTEKIMLEDSFIDNLYLDDTLKKWWISVEDYLKYKRGEKIGEIAEISSETLRLNKRAEILTEVAKTVKKKQKKEAPVCVSCEIGRTFTIGTCGHSFCEGCMREQLATFPVICKYCGKPFTEADVIRINW